MNERDANRLKTLLEKREFLVSWEQVPGRGACEKQQAQVLENARRAAGGGRVHALSITDNPGGHPAIAVDALCAEIRKLGIEPVAHFALRDKSRNQCESQLYQLAALGVKNLLVLSGDYPARTGFLGMSSPVFDLDSVTGLQLVQAMNRGLEYDLNGKQARLAPAGFFAGAACSPFKQTEAETIGQYHKLRKKIQAGAGFIFTQVGYDARKLHELLLWLKLHHFDLPAIATIYVLSYPAARVMHANGVPGCVVTDKLLAELADEAAAPDKGRSARLERAARMYALVKGMGFSGVSISGQNLGYESVEHILRRGAELGDCWRELVPQFDYPQADGFYYYEKDAHSGLNLEKEAARQLKAERPAVYFFSRAVHSLAFEPQGLFFGMMRRLARSVDRSRWQKRIFHALEYFTKYRLYECEDCGDCALFDVAYLCPLSQCPKDQRNGPCGGSYQGWCEVYPGEKQCIWVRAYARLAKSGGLPEALVPPCNWELRHTSSWLNYFLGRDHIGKRLGLGGSRK